MSLDDGIVGVLPAESNDSNGSDGQAVRINCCYYNPDPPARTNCLELTTKGASFTIQFHSESERRAWIRALKQTSALERNSGTAAAGTGAMNASGSISTVSIPVHPTPQVPPGSAA
ncbi:hypothetical protein BCR44DRAFT_1422877 [Catenaria anguillulae PL171]|uniref:PH domain-containing protein n=1 Tax=Catenaria anguillulae PL171 TaxID=765915 RepID=A0A1Y2I3M5_9FUNG|nr:hypothetical protein BCR44DRAFT_1422877 [Catenaria anguillulae PL171]